MVRYLLHPWFSRSVVTALMLLAVGPEAARAQRIDVFSVSYLSGTTVYLDGGRAEGLAVGDRLTLVRQGETVAIVEVAFVADHSASCRVVSELRSIQVGDLASIPSRGTPDEATPPASGPIVEDDRPSPPTPPVVAFGVARQSVSTPWARPSGSFSLRVERFVDGTEAGGDLQDLTGRLNLHLREIGGGPFDLRMRARTRRETFAGGADRASDRLYELSLLYAPPEGRFSLQLGRIGASPIVSLGYLDGALVQVRLLGGLYGGGFYGARPLIEELGFDSDGAKWGGFLRYSTLPTASQRYAEVVLLGAGESDAAGLVSREYVALESRFGSGSRWSLFQRAELDLARQWGESGTAQESQLSALFLSGSYRFSDRARLSLTYDQHRNYRTAETRDVPEDFFDSLLRQGLRVSLQLGRPKGWQVVTIVGVRSQERGQDPTTSLGLSLFHNHFLGRRLLVGADASVYSGGLAEGYLVTIRGRKLFTAGHELGLSLGTSSATTASQQTRREHYWGRISGVLLLPGRFFLLGEVEQNLGDELQGLRFSLELGYRL